MVYTLEISK
jgi:2,4-dienoyl-CoA reductase-like NADH-dependent reductase (Old Yellow Enzyme family)